MKLLNYPVFTRIAPIVVASLGLFAATASALEKVDVFLVGKSISHGKSLKVDSKNQEIANSEIYTYRAQGTVGGTGQLAGFLPAGTPLSAFLDLIAPNSSALLKGSVEKPPGAFPFTIVNERISGAENIPGLGRVSIAVNLKVEILQSGVIEANLTNVKIKRPLGGIPGTIKFGKNTKITVTTAPVVQFKSISANVAENVAGGNVLVQVSRSGYQKTVATVAFATSDDTALANEDYTAVTTGTVTFASGQVTQTISIPIINNSEPDGFRRFKVTLSTLNGSGVVLGPKTTTTIGISNDDL